MTNQFFLGCWVPVSFVEVKTTNCRIKFFHEWHSELLFLVKESLDSQKEKSGLKCTRMKRFECQFIRMLVSKRFKTVSNALRAFFLFGVNVAKPSYRANMSFLREVVKKNAVVTENSKDSPPENQGENIGKHYWIYVFFS